MAGLLRPRHGGKSMYFPCIDDYFTDYNNRRRSQLGQPFGPSIAGGGLAFLLDGTQVASCMQVAAGCVISGTTDFYLVSHMDCGAYKHVAGLDWSQHSEAVQLSTLYRDLHTAEKIARDFLTAFKPREGWQPPEVTFHLEVVNLQEQIVPEPKSLEEALPFSDYNGIRIPA